MGYSVNRDADLRLKVIMKNNGTDLSNGWYDDKGSEYFEERGKENADGAYTATVMRLSGALMATKVGSIRIEGDGKVTRFPFMNKAMKAAAKKPLEGIKPMFVVI